MLSPDEKEYLRKVFEGMLESEVINFSVDTDIDFDGERNTRLSIRAKQDS